MSASFDLLQRYYHARESTRLNKIIEQIDAVSHLLLKLLACDFVAVFYRKDTDEGLVPITYHNWEGGRIVALAELEQEWRKLTDAEQKAPRGFRHFDADAGISGEESDIFAQQNCYTSRFAYPIYIAGHLRGVVVAYWSKRPQSDHSEVNFVLNPLAEVIISCMALAEEMQSIGSFSLRLTTLISMFELPLDEHRIPDLLSEMLKAASAVAPRCSVGLISRDPVTGAYAMSESAGSSGPDNSLASDLASEVGIILDNSFTMTGTRKGWHDLSERCDQQPESVVAVDLFVRDTYRYAAVFWNSNAEKFSSDELQLISFFGLFSHIILSNAFLVRDLTKARARVLESSSRLADAETMAALADMSSGVAHDFNNIIGAIVGRLQILKIKCQDEKMIESLAKVESTALEGAETVRRLQQFTTSVRAKDLKAIDLRPLVLEYLNDPRASWRALAEEKKVAVELRCSMESATVNGVREDLITVLEQLVQNAVEFAPEGTKVHVSLLESGPDCILTVGDQGPGIPDGIRSKVFYPFFSTKSSKGAGLGLAVVYGIVTRMGGKVTFDTEIGRGTAFKLTFERVDRKKEISDITKKIVSTAKLKILVVDDDEQIREVLGDMLSLDGHTPTTCKDGYTALKSLENESFDMMVTDLGMPGMSGLDLAGIVHEKNPQMPIAMITGWGTQLNHDEMALKGIRAVLAKPFHLKDVKSMVNDLTSSKSA